MVKLTRLQSHSLRCFVLSILLPQMFVAIFTRGPVKGNMLYSGLKFDLSVNVKDSRIFGSNASIN
jgi:hypothetical protein